MQRRGWIAGLPVGRIMTRVGPTMPAEDNFEIVLKASAAKPHGPEGQRVLSPAARGDDPSDLARAGRHRRRFGDKADQRRSPRTHFLACPHPRG
ncbi:MAG: hypothetical protein EOS36_18015 [Mesorhizobium sp.]|nr:MAG: hypothetical protein EOS36_18015 [Mesorhizobium sp.]RWE32341.1 MAG: hypothetical protein EOS79_30970 [Mesorhizobium sp.]